MQESFDTIVALATPPGRGAIAIVRLSGPHARAIADKVFAPVHGAPLSRRTTHTLTYGYFHADGTHIDDVLAAVMWAPKSYTGEDSIEFHCHGGPAIISRVVSTLSAEGARAAQPGEFTRRAFLHGKIDLAQAEAIADMINAPTERARRAACAQLSGALSQKLSSVSSALHDVRMRIEAHIDFSEDIADDDDLSAVLRICEDVRDTLSALCATADAGRILRDGYCAVITGPTNVGKSSLLNLLAREERALVTEIPGTTRDTLEVDVNVNGWPVRFIDTAGMRASTDVVEQQGIVRAQKMIAQSDMVILVHDISQPPPPEVLAGAKQIAHDHPVLWVWNKSDLACVWPSELMDEIRRTYPYVEMSAMTGAGVDAFHDAIVAALSTHTGHAQDDVYVMRARHQRLLAQALECVMRACDINAFASPELLAQDLREAHEALSELIGITTSEDILDAIFADFCIGK